MGISSDFSADIRRALQLEEQRQRDPRAILPLIQVYKRMLERLRPNEGPTLYAVLQNNLGEAYRNLPTGDRASNLAQAIRCYQEALRFRTPEAAPLGYAMTQHNLGTAYYDLPTGDRASNLIQAINCYQQALRFWTPEAAPFEYAATQNNLGIAYQDLPTGDRASNLGTFPECWYIGPIFERVTSLENRFVHNFAQKISLLKKSSTKPISKTECTSSWS